MSIWKQNYEALQIGRIRDALGMLDTVSTESLDSNDLVNLARLQKALHVLDVRMSSLDPELFHPTGWSNIASWLSNLQTYVREFAQSANSSQLQNANNTVDEILNALKPIDVGPPSETASAVLEASTAFRQRLIDEIDGVRRRTQDVDAKLASTAVSTQTAAADVEALRQTIDQQKTRLDQAIAEFQRQFSQAEATRVSEFSAASQRFVSEFGTQKKALLSEASAATDERTAEWAALMDKTEKASTDCMSFFTKRQTEVNAIFGAIGSASLSGHFALTADNDAKAANLLRWIALALMAAMIAVGGISFYQSFEHTEVDWRVFLFRLGTIFVIAIPAVYAAQESSKHRRREHQNRKMQIELASIDAYLIELPEPKRHGLKEKLAEKFFGQPDAPDSGDPVTQHQLLDLISDAMKNLTKAK